MEKFSTLTSKIIPLVRDDVDTDQIIPARFLKVTDKAGLAEGLFCSWRYMEDGSPNPHFVLNHTDVEGAQILLAGNNFGCGSSREHAPWALVGWGIRAVISTSFADIFRNNAMKNGLLPLVVDASTQHKLFHLVQENPTAHVTIELESQSLYLPDGELVHFPIDPFNKTCLVEGLDPLQYLQRFEPQIEAYERAKGWIS